MWHISDTRISNFVEIHFICSSINLMKILPRFQFEMKSRFSMMRMSFFLIFTAKSEIIRENDNRLICTSISRSWKYFLIKFVLLYLQRVKILLKFEKISSFELFLFLIKLTRKSFWCFNKLLEQSKLIKTNN